MVVAQTIPEHATVVVHTPEGLSRRLRKPDNGLEVAVIMAATPKKLRELQSIEQMLENLQLILILPNAAPQTIARAHSLRPRYLTHIHSDFQDVRAVLKKLLALPEIQPEPTRSF